MVFDRSSSSLFTSPTSLDLFIRNASRPEVFDKSFVSTIYSDYSAEEINSHPDIPNLVEEVKKYTGYSSSFGPREAEFIRLPNGLTVFVDKCVDESKLYRYTIYLESGRPILDILSEN